MAVHMLKPHTKTHFKHVRPNTQAGGASFSSAGGCCEPAEETGPHPAAAAGGGTVHTCRIRVPTNTVCCRQKVSTQHW